MLAALLERDEPDLWIEVDTKMCIDCHDLFAYASMLLGAARPLTCTDPAAVHRFSEGDCSCRGLWL